MADRWEDVIYCNLTYTWFICSLSLPQPDQWYRVYLALFLHAGFIHLLFVLLFQYSVTIDIEKVMDFLFSLLFFLSLFDCLRVEWSYYFYDNYCILFSLMATKFSNFSISWLAGCACRASFS